MPTSSGSDHVSQQLCDRRKREQCFEMPRRFNSMVLILTYFRLLMETCFGAVVPFA
ncbi:hypothetical protein DM02DRAFT_616945 [Periconia macrospinosa]|uniref:Uncharacterized protein n=1 Tax=Periconia macrospinosa TaxID=97972 RepID=A0A2V1DIB3_9PLEO|nr:hypothetical protein DM02DRAFT_616945 [Periconia macrospinosa]